LKTLGKIVVLAVVLLIAIPLVKYRTIRPCEMLKKERIERIREGIESAGEDAREAVAEHSERAEQILDDVGEALEGLADGLAERVAELEVDEMSTRKCIAELWKMRTDN
jgi:F0F1-type ATP synthase membrane subunit b/b'